TTIDRERKFLKDYTPPAWFVDHVDLTFELDPGETVVTARMQVRRNPDTQSGPLVLHGQQLQLRSVRVNDAALKPTDYHLHTECLEILAPPADKFQLEIQNSIHPAGNTALEGLYVSGNMFCTQNEPEGFRRITYFVDRPDNMATYRTTIIADQTTYPVLLANGNPVEARTLDNGRHLVVRDDPYAKPSYLFALVAGNLGCVRDTFTTRSGRSIQLEIYVDPGNEEYCQLAMRSLKEAMQWDEQTFGLEYDLDTYMIVAVRDFNMGAMENKGLNIFNAKLVLADPRTATDEVMEFIQAVIGHEYFHNWTGNRVTCRDWFQLTLKEGLTVYRDQRFTADMTDAGVKRIKDVLHLREAQFPEDAGPMAHPIQPKSYLEMNNFYTMTVYEKGAEVIRMIATIIGLELFRRGIDRYFELFDGQAVTTGDFMRAMEAASGFQLDQFRRWYDQSGTPEVIIGEEFDSESGTLHLHVSQSGTKQVGIDDAPVDAQPLMIPLKIGLLHPETGEDLPMQRTDRGLRGPAGEDVLLLSEFEQTFTFEGLTTRPIVSSLRAFSAPVLLKHPRTRETLAFIFRNDADPYNRYEAGQSLAAEFLDGALEAFQADQTPEQIGLNIDIFSDAFYALITSDSAPAYIALAMDLPSEVRLLDNQNPLDFDNTHRARQWLRGELARRHGNTLREIYDRLHGRHFENPMLEIGARKFKNRCLALLAETGDASVSDLVLAQLQSADNMTDELSAFMILAEHDSPHRQTAVDLFYERWQYNSLVLDNWFAVQAGAARSDTLNAVRELRMHPAFKIKNPNKVRSLFGAFTRNLVCFHQADGAGYAFIGAAIRELDAINPSIAARLANAFLRTTKLDSKRKTHALRELDAILSREGLSNDVFEIVDRIRTSTE
ncbi:MAG: aminopeptidase N, partial [Leptospiraceae bacterium]|nr:aminopeptidase N [Leptospiraceae bacterium]